MDKVVATLRTLGILVALWVILAIAAFATGALRVSEHGVYAEQPAPERDGGAPAIDAGVVAEDAGPTRVAAIDAGPLPVVPDDDTAPDVALEPPPPSEAAPRFTICASGAEPSIVAAQVFGDERTELIVGCASGWEVFTLLASGPVRIAAFEVPPAPAEQRARTGPAAIGDVDGDGHADLALPLAYETDQGASRGGGLYWVPRDAFGGIREPVALAPIAAVDAAIAPMNAESGAEIAAMNRANALAQLPSEVWVLGGGAAPARIEALSVGLSGAMVRAGDLDRDANADVIALAEGRVTIHFGDGQGAFPRSHSFELTGAREIALADLNGDAGMDLVVLGEGIRWIAGGPLAGMEPHGVDGTSATLRGLVLADSDGDEDVDLIGWDHPRLIVMRQEENEAFVATLAIELAAGGSFGPRRHALADLDLDGSIDDLALVGTSAEGGALELVIVIDAFRRVAIEPSEPVVVPDAPLVLRAALAAAG